MADAAKRNRAPIAAGVAARRIETPAMRRLLDALDEENAAIRAGDLSRLDEFTERKARHMLELSRLTRTTSTNVVGPMAAELAAVREALAGNKRLIGAQLAAAGDVARLLAAALQGEDSDGTYAPVAGKRTTPA